MKIHALDTSVYQAGLCVCILRMCENGTQAALLIYFSLLLYQLHDNGKITLSSIVLSPYVLKQRFISLQYFRCCIDCLYLAWSSRSLLISFLHRRHISNNLKMKIVFLSHPKCLLFARRCMEIAYLGVERNTIMSTRLISAMF